MSINTNILIVYHNQGRQRTREAGHSAGDYAQVQRRGDQAGARAGGRRWSRQWKHLEVVSLVECKVVSTTFTL